MTRRIQRAVPCPTRTWRVACVVGIVAAFLGPIEADASLPPGDDGCVVAPEPNDQPADAVVLPATAACAIAEHADGGQDLYAWTVTDADASAPWTIATGGVPGQLTVLQVYRVELDAAGAVLSYELLAGADADSGEAVELAGLLWPSGTYYVAVGSAGPGAYRLDITAGEVPASTEVEPNDGVGTETPVAGDFAAAGDRAGTIDWFAWELSASDAAQAWNLDLNVPLGEGGYLTLYGPDGARLAELQVDATGRVRIPDLALAAGRYTIAVTESAEPASPYALRATSVDPITRSPGVDLAENEPNDLAEHAVPVPLGAAGAVVTGRLNAIASSADTDRYELTVDADAGGRLLDLKLLWPGGAERTMCLADDVAELQCGSGTGVVAFNDLVLDEATYRVEVTGASAPEPYLLRADVTTEPLGSFESEPNGSRSLASPMEITGEGAVGAGRLAGATGRDDTDVFTLGTSGEPQLWEVTATGPGIVALSALDVPGSATLTARPVGDEPAVLYDLFLLPGEHAFAVTGSGGEYVLEANALGPPPPGYEHEPNARFDESQRLFLGAAASGRLRPAGDTDTYRFSLQNDQPVRIAIDVPDGASMGLFVESDDGRFVDAQSSPGEDLHTDVNLPQGDYVLTVDARTASPDPYSIVVEPLDPYTTPDVDGDVPVPAELEMELGNCDGSVAAFVKALQRLDCTLTVTNTSPGDTDVALDGTTGNRSWRVEPELAVLRLSAGERLTVGVTVVVAPDAWSEQPVLVTVRGRDGDAVATASTMVTPDGGALPLHPEPAPAPLPVELLGGVNVAWSALGASATATPSDGTESRLVDGMAASDAGAHFPLGVDASVVVDLAGDAPVTLAGFTLTPEPSVADVSRLADFAIDVSDDGVTWREVVVARLTAEPTEQAFVLDDPVVAGFARLRPRSAQDPNDTTAALAEFSAIAATDPTPAVAANGFDIAAAEIGGHLVAIEPATVTMLPGDPAMFTADEYRQSYLAAAGDTWTWVIGFHHGRAAQISALSWDDPVGTVDVDRFDTVSVDVSRDGPVGPWEPLATWTLDRRAGSPTLTLDTPVWARYLRFTARVPGDPAAAPRYIELPGELHVVERAVDADYRTILGEWGGATSSSGLEVTARPPGEIEPGQDAGDSANDATAVALAATAADSVWVGEDEDWYRVDVPAGETAIAVTLTGSPAVGAAIEIVDAVGSPVPTAVAPAPGSTTYTAAVEPGAEYFLHVTEPPTSIVFAYDTSSSIGPFVGTVYAGLNRFAAGIEPGSESVNVVPFGAQALLEAPTDEPYLVQAALTNYGRGHDSSEAEAALLASMDQLADVQGERAIVLITDAQSSVTSEQVVDMWADFGVVNPRVYAFHIVGGTAPDQDLMQDWAAVNPGGEYRYLASQADMDVAFDRALAQLRGPSVYTLTVEVTDPPAPGQLSVPTIAAGTGDGAAAAADPAGVGGAAAVALVLDTSGSMLQTLPTGERRIDAARAALTTLVADTLPAGTNVSLRVFGTTPDSCETTLLVPQAPLDPAAMSTAIADVPVVDGVRTPIGASLAAVAGDFGDTTGPRLVVFVSDGEETCGGDPAAAIAALRASGVDVRVNIVGFALDDGALQAQFTEWATLGGGQYFDATDQASLTAAIAAAAQPTFEVRDAAGDVVATGQAGGPPLDLPAGTYTVVVHTPTPTEIPVEITPGEHTAAGGEENDGSGP